MSKRWFVVRPIKLNSGDIQSGQYLTKAQEEEIPTDLYRSLVRGVRLFDATGEVEIPWRERNKLKLRHRAFSEIGTIEAKKLHDLSIERMASGRAVEFVSPREKVLAEEIRMQKVAEAKVKVEAPEVEEVAEEKPKPKPRRRRAKVETPIEDMPLNLPDV